MPTGYLLSVNKCLLMSFWGHSVHLNFRQAYISKMADCRAKQSETWASEVSIQCIQGTFDSKVLKVTLGSVGAFPIFSNLVSRKQQVLKRNAPLCYTALSGHFLPVKQSVKVPGLLVIKFCTLEYLSMPQPTRVMWG